jgi:hypothetical protein
MSGWTVVDTATNKSLPVGGTQNSGTGVPYVAPVPWAQDPVQKMRVSTPQSLVDTDFEYGTQPTKWESISLQNNRASCYYIAQQPLNVTSIVGVSNSQCTVNITFTGTIPSNSPIFIQNSGLSTINGWAWVLNGGTNTTVTAFIAPPLVFGSLNISGSQYFISGSTYVYVGYFFTRSGFSVFSNFAIVLNSGSQATVTTNEAHGLSAGSYVYLNTANIFGVSNLGGAYIVDTVPTYNTFTIRLNGFASGFATCNTGQNTIYARPAGFVEPRTFDGGVAFTAGAGVPNQQLIRQTRRYFRYQSGKGIQFSTGSCLKPPLFVNRIQGSGGLTASVFTRFNHNLVSGTQIQVQGANQGVFNGTFTVLNVISPTEFTYLASSNTPAIFATGSGIRVSPLSWYGSTSRLGMFDQQNGMFFEYDGQKLYAVLRNSINQISGSVIAYQGYTQISGYVGTAFLSQLQPGQFIVMRGQSYRVVDINSDGFLSITPEYRGGAGLGSSTEQILVSQTVDLKIPQSEWNLDKCDGTGPSGYNLDLTRMQMWYIDYSWYGAGFIRWGVRGTNGQVTYVHQLQNNNKQFEAYMRSGNMAAHYELSSLGPITFPVQGLSNYLITTTTANVTNTATTIPVSQTFPFNTNGGVVSITSSTTEYISYTGVNVSASTLTGCVRGFGGTRADDYTAGVTVIPSSIQLNDANGFPPSGILKLSRTFSSNEYVSYVGITRTGTVYGLGRTQPGGQVSAQDFPGGTQTCIELASPEAVPSLSHWGSSVIMDGRFDDDKSLIFNYGTPQLTTNTSTTQLTPILAIRIAPAADNGTTGVLGAKEVINRMQLELVQLGIYSSGPLLVNLVLNGFASSFSGSFISPITQATGAYTSSLAQVATNTTNAASMSGGESVSAAFTNTNGETTLDLSGVRDLGNAIIGGGVNNSVPNTYAGVYPDGPDILYVCVTPLTATAITVSARLSWKEAQA